jgi:hypothetical protein
MKKEFNIKQLPGTYRDANIVTHPKHPYLWIDSLCIIQDSALDWRLESSRMGSVYANSYLTIAAANADDDSKGFPPPKKKPTTRVSVNFQF